MQKIKLMDGTVFDLEKADHSTEYAEGQSRSVLSLTFPETYTAEELAAAFGNEENTRTLVIGEVAEDGTVLWLTPEHQYFMLMLSCGMQSVLTGTDPETGAEIYETKLVVKQGKRTPTEIDLYNVRKQNTALENQVTDLQLALCDVYEMML